MILTPAGQPRSRNPELNWCAALPLDPRGEPVCIHDPDGLNLFRRMVARDTEDTRCPTHAEVLLEPGRVGRCLADVAAAVCIALGLDGECTPWPAHDMVDVAA